MAIVADLSGNSPIGSGVDGRNPRPGEIPSLIPNASAQITVTSNAQTLGPWGPNVRYIRLAPTPSGIYYEVGANPTAVADTSVYIGGEAIEYVKIKYGDKISVIDSGDNSTTLSYAEAE